MKLYNYLKEGAEGRVKKIDEVEFQEGIKNHCMQALKASPIYRGTLSLFQYGFISPGKFVRKSANTANWYTLLINDSKKWAQYPKRSLICTNDKRTAEVYSQEGPAYRVFPFDGAKIGICPSEDMWGAFEKVLDGDSLDSLAWTLNTVFRKATGGDVSDSSIETMKLYAKSVPDWFKNTPDGENDARDWIKSIGYKGGDFMKFLDDMLSPTKNGFKLTTIDRFRKLSNSHEVWTDADCYMMEISDYTDSMIKELV